MTFGFRPALRFSALTFLTFAGTALLSGQAKPVAQAKPVPVHTGIFRGRKLSYQTINGRAVYQGDIGLDHVEQVVPNRPVPGTTLDYLKYRWPLVGTVYQIPYTIDPTSGDTTNIGTAIGTYNSLFTGVIQWVPHSSEANWVNFKLDPSDTSGAGASYLGMVGNGVQLIWGSGSCTVATLLHEMGHATGFWHEQERPDRDQYVTVNFANIVNTVDYASQIQTDNVQAITLYDWASIMHYTPWNFTKNGLPTLETIPAGMTLANSVGYSAGDIDAVKRLYGAAPTSVTVTSNPVGLQVIVDGAPPAATPLTFSWALGSTHTLSVPTNAQSLAGTIQGSTTSTTLYYTFGRWNDSGAQSHTITVLPGNGELATPATSPAVTVYSANFIQIVPYSATAYPAGTGTTTPSPAPVSYPGFSGLSFYTARQPVTVTATPNSGQSYYQFINSPYWVPGGLSVNPKSFLVPDTGNPISLTTYFVPSTSPIYTFGSSPEDTNFYVNVDGGYWPAPTSFSPYYEGTSWNTGTPHTISVDNPEYPWTSNTRFAFSSWSDGGAQSHSILLPSASTTYTATLTPQYYVSEFSNETCGGSVVITPASPTGDSYYSSGASVDYTATIVGGWNLTGWITNQGGVGGASKFAPPGASNPLSVSVTDEENIGADFNTIATPLTLTSLSPAGATAGAAALTLTLTGTGFTPNTVLFYNNSTHAFTYVNANEITVPLTTTDLATAGGMQVFVENYPTTGGPWNCAAYGALPFNVANAPLVKPAPQTLSFTPEQVGTTSAAKNVTIKNTTKAVVNLNPVTVNGPFSISSNTCGATLKAGATCTVGVEFSALIAGAQTGSLAISDNAPDSPQMVALTGTGQLPLGIAPVALTFASTNVGTTSAAQTITLTNNEATTLNFAYSVSGNFGVNAGTTTCGSSLATKATCKIAVNFTPTMAGSLTGALALTDSSTFSPQILSLTGTGAGGSTPPLTFTPLTLTFAAQAVNTVSVAKTVTVKNSSTSPVTLNSFTATGDFAAVGSGTKPCTNGLVMAASATCTLSVTFAPPLGSSGSIKGALVFAETGAVAQEVYDVKGTSALPISFTPTSLTFTAQTVATGSAVQTVTLTNNLSSALSPVISSTGEFSAVAGGATPCGASLAAKATCTINVTFTPSAIGNRSSAVTVTDSASPGVETLNVKGTGQ